MNFCLGKSNQAYGVLWSQFFVSFKLGVRCVSPWATDFWGLMKTRYHIHQGWGAGSHGFGVYMYCTFSFRDVRILSSTNEISTNGK
jgi:hypothetical protein